MHLQVQNEMISLFPYTLNLRLHICLLMISFIGLKEVWNKYSHLGYTAYQTASHILTTDLMLAQCLKSCFDYFLPHFSSDTLSVDTAQDML